MGRGTGTQLIGADAGREQPSLFSARTPGAVIDAGADAFAASLWVDCAAHDHCARVQARIVLMFSVMLALLAEFTILTPCVLRECEHGCASVLIGGRRRLSEIFSSASSVCISGMRTWPLAV